MSLSKEKKQQIVQKHTNTSTNTGSVLVQVSLLTERIKSLTEHLKVNRKDYSSKTGLFKLVSKRKRLLSYLKNKDIDSYRNLISVLNLRS